MTTRGELAELLRALREAAGLSQEELASRAGLSSHAVSALERGTRTRPYPHTVRALADALGASEADRAALVAAVPSRRAPARTDAAPGARRGLPVPATPLVGRDDELARAAGLLREHRLVTLTGTGGVGKTRLALAVAAGLADAFADGACFVALAPVTDAAGVLTAVADAVDADPGPDAYAAVLARVQDARQLLVLDNLEHVLDAAPAVAALVEAAPGLTVLATSRAPLRVRGEVELPVEPLTVPPAVELLRSRAEAVSPGWGRGAHDGAAVEAICDRLAGLPLALELAAARARLLDPPHLLARLDALPEGPRDLPARQRTMRATLDWSYGLLGADEQAMLRHLSVFVGGFRLDDLEGTARRAGLGGPSDVLLALEGLAEQSLVVSESGPDGTRHRLLEPVAQYARARAEEAGDRDAAVRAHAAHYLALAEEAAPRYLGGEQVDALARIDAEHPNLTAAVERSLALGLAGEAGRMCWALWMYWWLRGHHVLGARLSEAVLAHGVPPEGRAHTSLAAATMRFAMDDVPAALGWWDQAVEHAVDPAALANGIAGRGLAALATGDLVTARARFEEARAPAEQGGLQGEWTWALSMVWSGTVDLLEGDFDAAVAHVEQGLASARRRGDRLTSYIALYNLTQVELLRGRHAEARRHLEEGMRLSLETGDQSNLAYLLDASAVLEAAEGTLARVPLLLGAAQSIREGVGSRGYGYYRPDPAAVAAAADEARRHLGADRFDDALDTGRGLAPERAAGLVLARAQAADAATPGR